jgi:fluoroacetyl-CoA thioesterase
MPSRRRAAYGKRMALASGLTASITLKVEEGDTALAIGSGDVPVLATPRLVTLVEQASVQALGDRLGPGKTSVGYEVQLAHLSPTPVGTEVTAEATLEGIEGRRLTFRVSVTDARGLVAAGRITRVIVVRDRFIERAQSEL